MIFVIGDRLRIDHHGDHRHQQGDPECFEHAADQKQHNDQRCLLLLFRIQ